MNARVRRWEHMTRAREAAAPPPLNEPVDPERKSAMQDFDRWHKPFRDLANEFGYNVVSALLDDGDPDPDHVEMACEMRRFNKQNAQFATDYFPKKVR